VCGTEAKAYKSPHGMTIVVTKNKAILHNPPANIVADFQGYQA
jgi:hypothetical protein